MFSTTLQCSGRWAVSPCTDRHRRFERHQLSPQPVTSPWKAAEQEARLFISAARV